ncbi:glycoside hydrolase family 88 protein [candidate division KSB1 bacterium]|nr:glycoside hydrolase family 88 protein [candidate division KSB1 bacterium]
MDNAIVVSLIKLEHSAVSIGDSTRFPTYGTNELQWKLDGSDKWTSGFYPGCLWYACELSGNPQFERWARMWTASIENEKYNTETHDLGFRFICTFGNGLPFVNDSENSRYKEILLTAASTLSRRYNEKVGCLSSNWDAVLIRNSFPVVIDIMANLNLLFWAAENGAPAYLSEYALTHARTTCRDFVRPDGSTYHIVRYNKNTGTIINKGTLQGAGDETTWSRGHAWMVYGLVETYAYSNDSDILKYTLQMTDYFIAHLPADHVSAWDFDSDKNYRDVSATAIVCLALFKLASTLDGRDVKMKYQSEAEAMLAALCQPPCFIESTASNCILDHSVHYLPINSNVDVPAIFADYYLLEAIVRYKKLVIDE